MSRYMKLFSTAVIFAALSGAAHAQEGQTPTAAPISPQAAPAVELPPAEKAGDSPGWIFSGRVTPAGQIANDPASSKFNEYRDLGDGVFLHGFDFEALDGATGNTVEFRGSSLFREDKNVRAGFGRPGKWGIRGEWDELRHLLSNKASSVYDYSGGLFSVTTRVPEFNPGFVKDLAPANNSTTLSATNDPIAGAYIAQFQHPVELQNQRRTGTAEVTYFVTDNWNFKLGYLNQARDGNKIGYGPIGDRPPRSLNIQMTEPLDYRTQEFRFETDYDAGFMQLNATYLYSDFKDKIDAITWQNIYTGTTGDSESWAGSGGKRVATAGRRPLAPDNQYHSPSLTLGVDLPLDSRLTATASLGFMRQDDTLLPYSTNDTADPVDSKPWNDSSKLPRSTAEGKIDTKLFDVRYALVPMQGLNVQTFFRYYDLDNKTPTNEWRYVTDDTTDAAGTVAYVNKRRNLQYEFKKTNFGIDPSFTFPFWRTTLGAGIERELIDHKLRESNTRETIYRGSVRVRPLNWLSLRAKYQYGKRKENDFNSNPTFDSYWYTIGERGDNNDPKHAFENHPDTRQFDVADRNRKQLNVSATAGVLANFDISASYRYLNDDFDSHVAPSQPLLNYPGTLPGTSPDADRAAFTPGNQLGLLSNRQHQLAVDLSYAVTDRLTFTAMAGQEDVKSSQRGLEFDEMARINPGNVAAATEQGPWTRATNQWTADIRDRTSTVGIGGSYDVIPGKLKLRMDHLLALGKIEVAYGGFGAQSSVNPANALADNYQFGFRNPPDVKHLRYSVNTTLEYEVIQQLVVGLSYLFERYSIDDWMQDPNTPWYETVGTENFARDTSRDWRWGNRLPNLGGYLEPGYLAHVGTLMVTYRF